jgi:Tol biopolymer transport system component
MYADGTDLRNLSNLNWAADDMPDVSPDGTRVTFCTTRDIGTQIYVMNADGSDQRRLTEGADVNWYPRWSPDGARILFYRLGSGLHIMDADGQSERWLVKSQAGGDWSPDGTRIVYPDPAHHDLMTISPDGAGMAPMGIQGLDPWVYTPAWSADGSRIVFENSRANPGSDLFAVDPNGKNLDRLTERAGWSMSPAWTSDGARIVFSSNGSSLFTMLSGGGDVQRLVGGTGWADYPSWHGGSDLTRPVSPRGKNPFTWGWLKRAGALTR